MTTRIRGGRGQDDGVALVVSISLIGLVGILMLAMLAYAISETRASGRDRQRASAVTSAEGQLDVTLAQIQNSTPETLPCGQLAGTTSQQSAADVINIETTVTYFRADGTEVTDCALLPNAAVTQAKVLSVGASEPLAGQAPAVRRIETLVELTPTFVEGLNQAIFGNAGVSLEGNGEIFGQDGKPDGNVYSNGNFVCKSGSNQVYHGSILVQGTATFSGSCLVDVDIWAKGSVVGDGPKLAVGGNVMSSQGSVTLPGQGKATVARQVRANQGITWEGCATTGKCVSGVTMANPPAYSFPVLDWNATVQTAWTAQGYTIADLRATENCTPDNQGMTTADYWVLANASSTGRPKTVMVTNCRLTLSKGAGNIALTNDLALFAFGGIKLEKSMTFRSDSATQRSLYFVQPYSSTCDSDGLGIKLGNLVTVESTVNDLMYTPCNVQKSNNSDQYGQVYAGGTATVSNKLTMFYRPLPVFGLAPQTDVVKYYELDTLYRRELMN